jgi:ABC-type xylose transport system permease subunit
MEQKAKQSPTFINNEIQLIQLLKNIKIDQHSILSTIDVVSLYKNIPHIESVTKISLRLVTQPALNFMEYKNLFNIVLNSFQTLIIVIGIVVIIIFENIGTK